jgi:hypothetical protein
MGNGKYYHACGKADFHFSAISPPERQKDWPLRARPHFPHFTLFSVKLNKWRQLLSLLTARDMNFVHFPGCGKLGEQHARIKGTV